MEMKCPKKLNNREFKFHVDGKRQIQVKNFSKLRETTKLCVEIMNRKRQVKGKFAHVVQIRVCHMT